MTVEQTHRYLPHCEPPLNLIFIDVLKRVRW